MKNEMIAQALKAYRKLNQLSVQDVVIHLKEQQISVSPKTIYSWENGTTKPDIPTLMVLCNLYQIPNIQQVLGYSETSKEIESPYKLTLDEQQLIDLYRMHPEMHDAVKKLLK